MSFILYSLTGIVCSGQAGGKGAEFLIRMGCQYGFIGNFSLTAEQLHQISFPRITRESFVLFLDCKPVVEADFKSTIRTRAAAIATEPVRMTRSREKPSAKVETETDSPAADTSAARSLRSVNKSSSTASTDTGTEQAAVCRRLTRRSKLANDCVNAQTAAMAPTEVKNAESGTRTRRLSARLQQKSECSDHETVKLQRKNQWSHHDADGKRETDSSKPDTDSLRLTDDTVKPPTDLSKAEPKITAEPVQVTVPQPETPDENTELRSAVQEDDIPVEPSTRRRVVDLSTGRSVD